MRKYKFYNHGILTRIFLYTLLALLMPGLFTLDEVGVFFIAILLAVVILFLVRVYLSYTAIIIGEKKIIMYEQKIFRIKTIAYTFEKVLGYQVVDKKIIYV